MALRVRSLDPEEASWLHWVAAKHPDSDQMAQRARMILLSSEGQRVPAIARELHVKPATVRQCIKRFNARGRPSVWNDLRGRPAVYTDEQVQEVCEVAATLPWDLGLPFAWWTLDRLQTYLNAARGISIHRSRLGQILARDQVRPYGQRQKHRGLRDDVWEQIADARAHLAGIRGQVAPPDDRYVSEHLVRYYHYQLDTLAGLDVDVAQLRIPNERLADWTSGSSRGVAGPLGDAKRSVEASYFLAKLDPLLARLDAMLK